MAVNDKKLVNAKALQDVAKGVYEQVQLDIDAAVAEEKPAEEVTFSAPMDATISATGGIKAGEYLDGLSVQQILSKLLYPHVDHSVSNITITPSGGVFEKGTTVTVTQIKGYVTKKSNPITRVEITDGSNVLQFKEGEEVGASNYYTFSGLNIPVTNNTTFKFVAYANGENGKPLAKSGNAGAYTFVHPYYYGVVGADEEITGEVIKGLTKEVKVKETKTYTYNALNQRAVIAYPKSYGEIKKVLDPSSFNVTATFVKQEVEVLCEDGSTQVYYVYANAPFGQSNFKFTFSY